jgi:hypothetical protein
MTLSATIGDTDFGGNPNVSIEQSTTCAFLTPRIPWMKLLGKGNIRTHVLLARAKFDTKARATTKMLMLFLICLVPVSENPLS